MIKGFGVLHFFLAAVRGNDWVKNGLDPVPFRRIDGRVTDEPKGCCSMCTKSLKSAERPNIPVNMFNRANGLGLPHGLHGHEVTIDHEMKDAIACIDKNFPATKGGGGEQGEVFCECRLDVAITTNYFYLCEDTHNDWWRVDGNTILTGGPYHNDLVVDRVSLSIPMPWTRQDPMLWIHLFANSDNDNPCGQPFENRPVKYISSRFDMSQYVYFIYPNETIPVPSAWTFSAENRTKDVGWYYLKDVTTYAHFARKGRSF